jgi:hypothetical protein
MRGTVNLQAESCSRQLRAWAQQLQNSDVAGQRRLSDASQRAWQRAQRADAFLARLQAIRDQAAANPSVA